MSEILGVFIGWAVLSLTMLAGALWLVRVIVIEPVWGGC